MLQFFQPKTTKKILFEYIFTPVRMLIRGFEFPKSKKSAKTTIPNNKYLSGALYNSI